MKYGPIIDEEYTTRLPPYPKMGKVLYNRRRVKLNYFKWAAFIVTLILILFVSVQYWETNCSVCIVLSLLMTLWVIYGHRTGNYFRIYEYGLAWRVMSTGPFIPFEYILAIYPYRIPEEREGLVVFTRLVGMGPYTYRIAYKEDPSEQIFPILKWALRDRWDDVFKIKDPITREMDYKNIHFHLETCVMKRDEEEQNAADEEHQEMNAD